MIRFTSFNVMIMVGVLGEWAAILFFFRMLDSEQKPFRHKVNMLFLLLALLPIYLIHSTDDTVAGSYLNQLIRTSYHYGVITVYLLAEKQKKLSVAAYIAGVFISIYLVAFNVKNITAFFLNANMGNRRNVEGGLDVVIALFLFIYLAGKLLNLNDIGKVGAQRCWVLGISIVFQIYIKRYMIGVKLTSNDTIYWADQLLIPTIGLSGILIMLLMFERSVLLVEKEQRIHMERMRQDYELQNARRALQAGADIRRMYHDMKHHLLAIQAMMDSNQPAKEYLMELVSEFDEHEIQIQTGNSIIDGILNEKITRARMDGIDFNVYVDLKRLEFMQALDLVTIFGNAIDNAIEALRNVPKGERIAYLKSFEYGNVTVLQFSNCYKGELTQENGQLKTIKTDSEFHGIGLKSIRKATEKYGGSVVTEIDPEERCFRLAVLIPCKD